MILSARVLAVELLGLLTPVTERREIAGSLRRGVVTPKDIEIVCIPKAVPSPNLFNPDASIPLDLDEWVGNLEDWKLDQVQPRNGPRWKRLAHIAMPICCDLFITSAPNWGIIFCLRTGPADFSKALVTLAQKQSKRVDEGQLWHIHRDDSRTVIPTPEEASLFAALGVSYLEPNRRTPGALFHAGLKGKTNASDQPV